MHLDTSGLYPPSYITSCVSIWFLNTRYTLYLGEHSCTASISSFWNEVCPNQLRIFLCKKYCLVYYTYTCTHTCTHNHTHWYTLVHTHTKPAVPSIPQTINTLLPHDIGHYLGMDVHDCHLVDHNTPLSPGMVITIEPGIYVHPGFTISDSARAKE